MADFLPIGLSRDANGIVSGLKEITTSDAIPENYLTISNNDPKWNANKLQNYPVCDTNPATAGSNPALVWNGTNWCASVITAAAAAGGGNNGNATAIDGYPVTSVNVGPGKVLVFDGTNWNYEPTSVYVTPSFDATAIDGYPVDNTNKSAGKVLVFNGTDWDYEPTSVYVTPSFDATAIRGYPVTATNEGPGKVLVFDGTKWNYEPTSVYVTPSLNATAIDGYPVTSVNVGPGKVLVFDGANWNYEPTSVYVAGGGGVTGIGVAGDIVQWLTTTSIESAGFSINPPTINDHILKWNSSTTAIDDLGYGRTDAAWNAYGIQSVSAEIPSQFTDGYVLSHDFGDSKLTWVRRIGQVSPTPFTPAGEMQTGEGQTGLTFSFAVPGASGASATIYTLPTSGSYAMSSIADGTFFVTSGNTVVPVFLPDSLLRFYGANGSFPTKAPPAELVKFGGEILYYDVTNSRYTSTGDLKVVGTNSLQATNLSATTVSATNYLNLPSSTIVWASANYATLAGSSTSALIATNATSATLALNATSATLALNATSATEALNATSATSALNAQQAPNGFNVTGTVSATTVSATNYLNLPPATASSIPVSGIITTEGSGTSATFLRGDGAWALPALYGSAAPTGGIDGQIYLQTDASAWEYAVSATSALNAQQAPSGFNVTGTLLATTVSATNYRNIRPYVSSVDSATTTTVNMGGDYDLYLVNTTTTSVTLYLPDASAWTSKQITISKVDDGGSYRSVTVSGTTLQTATNTVRLYDPTESVTVISNGTNWYSLDYDRAYGVVFVAKNSTGSTLTKGTPVRITSATGDNVLIGPVSAANNHVPEAPDGSLSKCIGVVEHSIPNGEFGHVLTKGTLYKFDTNAYSEGDQLYLASGGGFTNVKLPSPYDKVFLGIVTRQSVNNGSILIDIENPIHVNDIAGFNLTSSLINGDLISYDPTTSTFKNVQAVNVSGQGKFGSVSATSYFNLPSSTIVWASAGYADLAGSSTSALIATNATSATLALNATSATSALIATNATSATLALNATSATSALNARQAPNGFNVTGTAQATTLSGTSLTVDSGVVKNTFDIASGSYTAPTDSRLYVQGKSYFQGQVQVNNNLYVTGTASATTVSATNYLNLPSSTIVWASAGYADLAGSSTSALIATNATSATSALNARQAPAGFNVTGTMSAGAVSSSSKAYFDDTVYAKKDLSVSTSITASSVSATVYLNLPFQYDASSLNGSPLDLGINPLNDGDMLVWDSTNSFYTIVPSSIFAGGGGAPTSVQYLTLATDSTLTNERVFTVGAGLTATDGGANGNYTVSANYTSAIWQPSATFGTAGQTVRTLGNFQVDQTVSAATVSATNIIAVSATVTSGDVSSTKLTDYSEAKSAPTISASAITFNLHNSQVFTFTLSSNISSVTISNTEPRANTVQGFTLIITADGTARTITWPGSVKWPGGTGPTLTSTNNKVDILSFVSPDNGTTWYGFTGGQNY